MPTSEANRPSTRSDAKAAREVSAHTREALVSLIALLYIEEHALLSPSQLASARESLDALLVETSGEETMLRKLIDTLAAQKAVDRCFGDLARVLEGIDRGFRTAEEKIEGLKRQLTRQPISAEEHEHFVGPFLSFGHDFSDRLGRFRGLMNEYLRAREQEARAAYIFDIARKAREQLKRRFEQATRGNSEHHHKLTSRVVQSFDYDEAEIDYGIAAREAQRIRAEIESVLGEFREMCQYATSPDYRDPALVGRLFYQPPYADVFCLYEKARTEYSDLIRLEADVRELFWLFQHAHGLCHMDFENFERAMGDIQKNTEAYFRAKREDEDVRSRRAKLEKIEALILFLERCMHFLSGREHVDYDSFSRTVSDTIVLPGAAWTSIADELMRMKVIAEAELKARLA